MIMPSGSFDVLALNCLQKSMMFTPCGPRAVPTGGAGVALPAGSCSLTVACTFFAMRIPFVQPVPRQRYESTESGDLFHLRKIQFYRRRPAENRDRNFQRAAIRVDVLDHARK